MLECGFADISTAAYIIPVFLGLVSPSNEPLLIYKERRSGNIDHRVARVEKSISSIFCP